MPGRKEAKIRSDRAGKISKDKMYLIDQFLIAICLKHGE